MPYKSLKQEKFFNANKAKLEREGVNVDEWNKASKGEKFTGKATSYSNKRPKRQVVTRYAR
jgi:hypothetical protein